MVTGRFRDSKLSLIWRTNHSFPQSLYFFYECSVCVCAYVCVRVCVQCCRVPLTTATYYCRVSRVQKVLREWRETLGHLEEWAHLAKLYVILTLTLCIIIHWHLSKWWPCCFFVGSWRRERNERRYWNGGNWRSKGEIRCLVVFKHSM